MILMLISWGATGFKYSEAKKKSQVSEDSPYYCGEWRHGEHLKLLSETVRKKNRKKPQFYRLEFGSSCHWTEVTFLELTTRMVSAGHIVVQMVTVGVYAYIW